MGAHTRRPGQHARPQGQHRGAPAPLLDLDLARVGTATGLLAAAAGTAVAFAPAAGAASSPGSFDSLKHCESGGNYQTNTGNGYYGAYQFDARTWQGLGYQGLPSQASAAVQDEAAARLQAARGWSPWPACSAKLGLRSGGDGAVRSAAVGSGYNPFASTTNNSESVTAPVAAAPVVPTTPPDFTGDVLTATLIAEDRPDVTAWQQRMHDRGWQLSVDGYFGPKSASVAAAFAKEKQIASGALGDVDLAMWNAAWELPVT